MSSPQKTTIENNVTAMKLFIHAKKKSIFFSHRFGLKTFEIQKFYSIEIQITKLLIFFVEKFTYDPNSNRKYMQNISNPT